VDRTGRVTHVCNLLTVVTRDGVARPMSTIARWRMQRRAESRSIHRRARGRSRCDRVTQPCTRRTGSRLLDGSGWHGESMDTRARSVSRFGALSCGVREASEAARSASVSGFNLLRHLVCRCREVERRVRRAFTLLAPVETGRSLHEERRGTRESQNSDNAQNNSSLE
jgi:hypothetical protein